MNYCVTGEQLTGVADAIRAKTGGNSQLAFPTGFESAIGGLMKLSDLERTLVGGQETFHPSAQKSLAPGASETYGFIGMFASGAILPSDRSKLSDYITCQIDSQSFTASGLSATIECSSATSGSTSYTFNIIVTNNGSSNATIRTTDTIVYTFSYYKSSH